MIKNKILKMLTDRKLHLESKLKLTTNKDSAHHPIRREILDINLLISSVDNTPIGYNLNSKICSNCKYCYYSGINTCCENRNTLSLITLPNNTCKLYEVRIYT